MVDANGKTADLKLRLSSEAMQTLRERANGHSLDEFVSTLLEAEMRRPTMDELLAPVRAEFAASGMSEDEINDLGKALINDVRRERRERRTTGG